MEAETPLAWKLCVLRAPPNCGNSPGSSVAATAGSPRYCCCLSPLPRCVPADTANVLHRSGTESDAPYNDAFENALDGPHDRSEYLRGLDPKNDSSTLESCPQSMSDFSAELPSNLQEAGQLGNGVEGGVGG